MTMEPSQGLSVQVVEPGSQDDPFSVQVNVGQQQVDDALRQTTSAPSNLVLDGEGNLVPTAADAQRSQPQDGSTPPQEPDDQPDIEALFGERLKEAQRGWDRRIEDQRKELQQLQKQLVQQKRDFELQGIPERDRARLKEQWQLEDERAALESTKTETQKFYRLVEAQRLLTAFGQYGLTEQELVELDSVDAMEALAKDKKIAFLENGGKVPSAKAEPAKAPAGSRARSDVGSQPSTQANARQMLSGPGLENMSRNIKNLFST